MAAIFIWPSWFSHLSFSSQTHPHLPRLVPTISKKKKLHSLFPLHLHKILHSFNLINLMMAAILNSAILDSAFLNKTLTQTNSIWLKLLHSHSTWWWQPSWILPSCICTKKLHSFILTQLDDGSHLEFCHVEFRHMASWIQTPCYLFSDSLQNTSLHSDSESN